MIRNTNPGISYELRDKYSVCRRFFDVATKKSNVHNLEAEIISFLNLDMRLYLLYLLSQVRWDRGVQNSHQLLCY